jgi:hypothetical protein
MESLDRIKALGPIPESHADRFRFMPTADRLVVGTIQCGVIFIMAFWSGPARQRFAHLKQVLETVDHTGKLELVVVDTDGCDDLHCSPDFNGLCHGWGEVAWIYDGQVMRTSGAGYHPEVFEQFTKDLVVACGAKSI